MQWYILIIISAILISFSEIIKKKILRYEHSTEFSTTYSLVITLLMVPFISYLDLNLPRFIIALLFVKSILLLVSSLLFMKAMRHNELSQIIPLKNLSPIFLMILAFFLLNSKELTSNKIDLTKRSVIIKLGRFRSKYDIKGTISNVITNEYVVENSVECSYLNIFFFIISEKLISIADIMIKIYHCIELKISCN